MQADNDLYEYALKDIEELKTSLIKSRRVEAYVFLDTPGNLGKRIFKMSPLHHHYQVSGLHESKRVTRFWIVGILLAIISIVTLKIR